MIHVNVGAGGTVFESASLDPSETNGQTLGKKRSPAVLEPLRENTLAVLPDHAFNEVQAHFHRRHQRDRAIILDALDGSTFADTAKQRRRIQLCGLTPMYALKSDGSVGLVPGVCRSRLCPTCQARRGRDLSARVLAITATLNSPRFVTLTIRSTNDSLKQTIDRLYAAFKSLRKQAFWKAHVTGGVAVAEVTRNEATGQWHPHLHVIVDGSFMPQSALQREWSEAVGELSIVDIRAVHDRRSAAKYLCDYVAKPTALTSWPAHAINEFAYASHGRRLIVCFGSCHRIRVPEDECETRPTLVSPLCSANRLLHAHRRGCLVAAHAVELLARAGSSLVSCLGIRRAPDARPPVALEPWEWEHLAAALAHITAADTAAAEDACPFDDLTPQRPPPQLPTCTARVDDVSSPFAGV